MLTYCRKTERYTNNQCPRCAEALEMIHQAWSGDLLYKNCKPCKVSWKQDPKTKKVSVNEEWCWDG